jgi:hypothetical protein
MHERAMNTADRLRNRKGRDFEEILAAAPEKPPEE